MKHTKGPWTHTQDGADFVCERITGGGVRDIVYSIRTGLIPNPPNAALIDLAPSMYDALRAVRKLLSQPTIYRAQTDLALEYVDDVLRIIDGAA